MAQAHVEKNDNTVLKEKLQFKTTVEVVLVYVAAFFTFLTLFQSLNFALYTILGYLTLALFAGILVAMLLYILYNLYVTVKNITS